MKTLLGSVKMEVMLDPLAKSLAELKLKLEGHGLGNLALAKLEAAPPEAEIRSQLKARLASRESWDVPEGMRSRWSDSGFDREDGRRARGALLLALQEMPAREGSILGASLAHGGGLGVAAVRSVSDGAAKVGIDVESAARIVPDRVYRRFSHPSERAAGYEAIALWCLKEAVFKLGMSRATPFREVRIELEVASGTVRLGRAEWPGGRACLGLVRGPDVWVAVACGI